MADRHTPNQRSYNMSRIRSKNTRPELIVRKYLFSKGFRYRIHDKKLPGNPDIVLKKYRTVVLVNGCFWHGHKNCELYTVPKTRTKWWIEKIAYNKRRDEKQAQTLKKFGWRIITVWGCDLSFARKEKTLNRLAHKISKSNSR
jgi:DNA mismatch endonuclease (patch repair protein)